MPRALITGITGQDGWYLSADLRERGYEVYGLVTPGDQAPLPPGALPLEGDMRDGDSILRALDASVPDEVYNLASLSSVAASWEHPDLVCDVNGVGAVRLLAGLRDLADRTGHRARFVQAGSAEIFGAAPAPQNEQTPLQPTNPYGIAKALAHRSVAVYRDAGVLAGTAILFNHESPRRPAHFVTRKITSTVARIAAGSGERLVLGNIEARRDWGFAGDYMRAMAMIGRMDEPGDFVIASGVSRSVADFVAAAFAHVGIDDWKAHVDTDTGLSRVGDVAEQCGDASKARTVLGWEPSVSFPELVGLMVDADSAQVRTPTLAD